MKKPALLLLLACAPPLYAQDFIQNYSFVNTGSSPATSSFANTGISSFFMSWSPQTSMNTCSVQVDSSADGSSWGSGDLIASQTCTTAGSTGPATLGSGKFFVRVRVTTLSGNGGLNVTLKGYGGGGSTGSSSSTQIPGINAASSPYNAKFDGRSSQDGVLNSTTTVTSATLSCTNADVGKTIFTVNSSFLARANSTVASCSGNNFIMNAAATASESGVNLIVCSDDTVALQTAWAAAIAASLPLYLPAGVACVSGQPFAIAVGGPPIPQQSWVINGAGINATYIGMVPSFSFSGITINHGTIFSNDLGNNACTYFNSSLKGFVLNTLQDWSVTGFNFGFPSWPAGVAAIWGPCQSHRLGIYNIRSANTIGMAVTNTEATVDGANIQGLGSTGSNGTGISVGPTGNSPHSVTLFNNIVAFIGTDMLMNGCIGCQVIGQLYTGAAIDISLTNSSLVQIADVTLEITSGTQLALKVDGTSTANLGRVLLSGASSGTPTGIQVLSGGKVRLEQVDWVTTGGTPTEINNAGTIFDGCNNTFVQSQITNTGNWAGNNCSVTGTALTAGAIVPSANWGTGAVISSPVGNTTDISFVLTNGSAAVGANPTLTYTFPTPFPSGRPNLCSINQTGGTQAQIAAEWSVGTPTATSVVFTYGGSPTINLTEFISVECR